jgi:hypothetical protein
MRRAKKTKDIPLQIADMLQDLIESAKMANLDFTVHLLELARLDVLMNVHGIAAEEIDQLRLDLERNVRSGDIIDLEQLRRSRRRQATR